MLALVYLMVVVLGLVVGVIVTHLATEMLLRMNDPSRGTLARSADRGVCELREVRG